jgi:hypothetical protein
MQETISEQIIQAFVSGRRNMQLEQLANTAPELLAALRGMVNLHRNDWKSGFSEHVSAEGAIEEAEKRVAS